MRLLNYNPLRFVGKTVFIFFLLLSVTGKAQDDTALIVTDTVPTEEVDEEVKDEETAGRDRFLKKWDWEEDSLVVQRKIPAEKMRSMQEEDAFWYANAVLEKKEEKDKLKGGPSYVPLGRRTWFQTLIWFIIIGSFAAFIIWFLADSNVGLFRRKNIPVQAGEEELIPEDIFAINYQREIDKAAKEGNYRLAVRLQFLRLLKNMSERNVIQYKQDKTNFDYLLQLQPTRYYKDFFRITRNYEYSWYGQFEVREDAYRLIQKDFEQFERQLY